MGKRTTAALAASIAVLVSACNGGEAPSPGGEVASPEPGPTSPSPAGGEVLVEQSFLEGPGVFPEGNLEDARVTADRGFMIFSYTGSTAFSSPETFDAPQEGIHIETNVLFSPAVNQPVDILYGVYCATGDDSEYQVFLNGLGEAQVFRNGPEEGDLTGLTSAEAPVDRGTPQLLEVECVAGGAGAPTQITVTLDGQEVLQAEDPDSLGSFTGVALAVDTSASDTKKPEGEVLFQDITVTSI